VADQNPTPLSSWSATFFTRLHRYRVLLRRRWWVLLLTVSAFVCYQAYQISQEPPKYESIGRMMLSGRFMIPEGSLYNEETTNFFGTQIALMTSMEVRDRAAKRLQVTRPELAPVPVDLTAHQAPRTSIFILQARGRDPEYTRSFLDAVMTEFLNYKREMRAQTSQSTLTAITDELMRLEKELRAGEEELHNFQKENNIVFLEEQGQNAASHLVSLNTQLANLKTEAQLLEMLDIDQQLDRQRQKIISPDSVAKSGNENDAVGALSPENDYARARQQIRLLEAERDTLSQSLKPKHPKILRLNDEIERGKKLLELFRQQSLEQLVMRRSSIKLQIENLNNLIKEEEIKALDLSRRMGEYQRIKGKVIRAQSLYEKLLASVRGVDVNTNIDQELISILENATPATSIRTGVTKGIATGLVSGLLLGLAILFILDRIDDRINSFTELRDHFEETVFGQIPFESTSTTPERALLVVNDPRHTYAEAFRNIRSSLLFIANKGKQPKTILITSAIPNEGKSTVAANFSITLSFAGSRVLLVDADLRRGVLHEAFDTPSDVGLAEVLQGQVTWDKAIAATGYENHYLLPRGGMPAQPGELFLQSSTPELWKNIAQYFDFVVIDSAPILATDDTPSLAPQIDGTLFVVRAAYTSARLTHNALDNLYQRNVNVMGLIFNSVDTSLPEYSYYKYKQYYSNRSYAKS
jgi:capsular exopolysaccharide synthesis family protein